MVLGTSTLAVAQSSAPTGADEQELILRVGTDVDLNTDNPWAVEAGSNWSVVTTQYDMLLKFDSQDLAPAPSLATGCEPNADSTEWVCTLRDGLKWSDGSPLDLERRGLQLSIRDRPSDPAVSELLREGHDVRNPG